jgi:hypothetical protein
MVCRMLLATTIAFAFAANSMRAADVPDGWTSRASRDEIKPQFSYEPAGGRDGTGGFVIEADQREGLAGWWETVHLDIHGGKYYRFQVWRKTENIAVPRRAAVARVIWRDDRGRTLTHEEPSDAPYAPGKRPPIRTWPRPTRPRRLSSCTIGGRPRGVSCGATCR